MNCNLQLCGCQSMNGRKGRGEITMKKRILLFACTWILMAVSLTGCGEPGTPPVLTVDGKDITLGDSSPASLPEGFEFTVGVNIPIGSLPGNSWLQESISARKDGETYARLYLYNPAREEVYYTGATIYKVYFGMNSEEASYWAVNNILVNGIDFYGMNVDEVKAAMQEYKKPSENSHDDGSVTLMYTDGDYDYTIRFGEDGLVYEVEIEMAIAKSYSGV